MCIRCLRLSRRFICTLQHLFWVWVTETLCFRPFGSSSSSFFISFASTQTKPTNKAVQLAPALCRKVELKLEKESRSRSWRARHQLWAQLVWCRRGRHTNKQLQLAGSSKATFEPKRLFRALYLPAAQYASQLNSTQTTNAISSNSLSYVCSMRLYSTFVKALVLFNLNVNFKFDLSRPAPLGLFIL